MARRLDIVEMGVNELMLAVGWRVLIKGKCLGIEWKLRPTPTQIKFRDDQRPSAEGL